MNDAYGYLVNPDGSILITHDLVIYTEFGYVHLPEGVEIIPDHIDLDLKELLHLPDEDEE